MKRSPFHRWTRCAILLAVLIAFHGSASAAETWRGLVVAPEYRCSPYDRRDYPYPQSVEPRIVAAYGGHIYDPYTGRIFASRRQTDIEHVVAVSEAHDSGLCAAAASTRRRFASDLLNLTLAAPEVNRCGRSGKCAKDAAEWLPPQNRCWFANRVVEVRRKYRLTIDRREASVLERVLAGCKSTEMVFHADGGAAVSTSPPTPQGGLPSSAADALDHWDDNRNGHISCKEARRPRIAPARRGGPCVAVWGRGRRRPCRRAS